MLAVLNYIADKKQFLTDSTHFVDYRAEPIGQEQAHSLAKQQTLLTYSIAIWYQYWLTSLKKLLCYKLTLATTDIAQIGRSYTTNIILSIHYIENTSDTH